MNQARYPGHDIEPKESLPSLIITSILTLALIVEIGMICLILQ